MRFGLGRRNRYSLQSKGREAISPQSAAIENFFEAGGLQPAIVRACGACNKNSVLA